MKITKHGQSCFLIESDRGSRILVDPGRFVFADKEHLSNTHFTGIDALVITHEHSDHFNEDTLEIIERERPLIFTTREVAKQIKGKTNLSSEYLVDGSKFGPMGSGEDVYITGVGSIHGPLPSGNEPPEVCGALLELGQHTFYTPGDTVVIKDTGAEVVAAPITGKVTANLTEAVKQIKHFRPQPKLVIPIHFDNPDYPDDSAKFEKAASDNGLNGKLLKNGESIKV